MAGAIAGSALFFNRFLPGIVKHYSAAACAMGSISLRVCLHRLSRWRRRGRSLCASTCEGV